VYEETREVRAADDGVSDAAEDEAAESEASVGGEGDEVDAPIISGLDDRLRMDRLAARVG